MSDPRFGLIDVEEGRAAKGGPMPDGDASPPTCATCKHWDGEPSGPPDRLGHCINEDVRGCIAVEDVGVGFVRRSFITDGTFGCTEHTARPLREDSQT